MADLPEGRHSVVGHPEGVAEADDPWKAFRSIEHVDLAWTFAYRHSLGKISRFFAELERGRLYATECPSCGQVWMPPRANCPDDLAVTRWVPLTGSGTLHAFSVSHARVASLPFAPPYVLAYVALDGTSTLCLHQLRNFGAIDAIRPGMRIKVAFGKQPVAHPLWLMWFEPADAALGVAPAASRADTR